MFSPPTTHTVARFSRHEGLTTDSGSVQHPNPPPLPPSPTPPSPPPRTHGRGKRTRTAYTQAQQDALELAFHANPYPDGFYRQKVSKHVGIAEDRIQVYNINFQISLCVCVVRESSFELKGAFLFQVSGQSVLVNRGSTCGNTCGNTVPSVHTNSHTWPEPPCMASC